MISYLPGTLIEAELGRKNVGEEIFRNIFAGGGLVLSQVSRLSGIEPYTIQNWIKRGFCTHPKFKLYSRSQFCRLIIINMLKDSLSITQVTDLLSHINGHLDDESDDMIDDYSLYMYFVSLISSLKDNNLSEAEIKSILSETLKDYEEPFSGGKNRLYNVLHIMTYAYFGTQLHRRAHKMMDMIDKAQT